MYKRRSCPARARGTRVDKVEGGYEITYFGLFSQCVQSQTLFIEHPDDLINIGRQIRQLMEEDKE